MKNDSKERRMSDAGPVYFEREREAQEKAAVSFRSLSTTEETALRVTLGLRVRAARNHLGLSGRALARLCGKSGSWVREVESGAQYAPWYLVVALAEATGWSVGWFCGFGARRTT